MAELDPISVSTQRSIKMKGKKGVTGPGFVKAGGPKKSFVATPANTFKKGKR